MSPSPTGLQAVLGELMSHDRWSVEAVERHRDQKLRELLEFSVRNSAYYRETLGEDAAERSLSELPILTKETMMDHYDDLVTDSRLTREGIDEHLAGPDPGSDFFDRVLVTTSGTTGSHGVFAYSREELEIWLAASLRILARIGGGPGMRLIGVGSPSPLFMSRRIFAGLGQTSSEPPPELSVLTPLDELVAGLNAYQPEALLGYPSVNALLAEEQLAGRLEISPRLIGCGSEVLTDDYALRMEQAWGVRPGDAYVTTEACPIASACPEGVGLHVCDDLVIVEAVDEDYRPVPPGTPGHRLLITNLINRVQPLIRYELTDSVVMAAGPNPTGMPWQRIERVDGRTGEILTLPSDEGEVTLHPHRLRAPFAQMEDVLQYQFEWDGRTLLVSFIARDGAPATLADQVRDALRAAIAEGGARGVHVEARRVSSIEREPGGAAKLKQVKVRKGG